ncbi:hypothetical protein GCM10027568_21760 [Humibacter soli]
MTIADTRLDAAARPAPVSEWPMLRELDGDTAQRAFHATMEAFARPGTVHRLPAGAVPSRVPAVVAPLLALADIMTPIAAIDSDDDDLAAHAITVISRLVAAKATAPTSARFGLAFAEPHDLCALNRGSHWSPEAGAMLFQRVTGIHVVAGDKAEERAGADDRDGAIWRLTGPGVKPGEPVLLHVGGLGERFVSQRAERVSDYPSGIDVLLVTDRGDVVGLSRTTVITVVDDSAQPGVAHADGTMPGRTAQNGAS